VLNRSASASTQASILAAFSSMKAILSPALSRALRTMASITSAPRRMTPRPAPWRDNHGFPPNERQFRVILNSTLER
jgi:hypothetical protein